MTSTEFWQNVYAAAVSRGATCDQAHGIADVALCDYEERFPEQPVSPPPKPLSLNHT